MIKINLLPYREKEKKENLKHQIIVLSGSLMLFLLSFSPYISISA